MTNYLEDSRKPPDTNNAPQSPISQSGGDGITKVCAGRANFFMEAGGAAAVFVSLCGENARDGGVCAPPYYFFALYFM